MKTNSINGCQVSPGAMAARFWLWALLCACLLCAGAANAQPSGVAKDAATAFGTVWRIQGSLSGSGVGAIKARSLHEGDAVYVGEKLRTSADGEAVVKTGDAGLVAVRPGAEFVVERYVAEGKTSDQFSTRLLSGSLRMITGLIGKISPARQRVITPTATIGIRGTDHEPFVITADLAARLASKEGAYDKVNRGGTRMEVGDFKLDIDPGKVGFARAPGAAGDRALLTLLMPVLLEKIPDFYVPGRFDAELDAFSTSSDEQAAQLLAKKQEPSTGSGTCVPVRTASAWLDQLDTSIARADAKAILAMFAPDVKVRATVRGADGRPSTLDLKREELVTSTLAAVKELKEYKQRRLSVQASAVEGADPCALIQVKSVVAESGLQGDKPFRFDSFEEYRLAQRNGQWLAIQAETVQR